MVILLLLCSMSKFDIKNYFQSIYKINVALVNTRIQQGVLMLLFVCFCYYNSYYRVYAGACHHRFINLTGRILIRIF